MGKNKLPITMVNGTGYKTHYCDCNTLLRLSIKTYSEGMSNIDLRGIQFKCGHEECKELINLFPNYSGRNKDCEPYQMIQSYAKRKVIENGWGRIQLFISNKPQYMWLCPKHYTEYMNRSNNTNISSFRIPDITKEQIRTADDLLRKAREKLKSERRPDMIIYDEVAEFTKDDMDKIAKVKESIDRRNKRRSEELLGPLFSDEVEESKISEKPNHTLESVINSLNELEHSLLWDEIQGEITGNSQAERWRQRFLIARDNYRIESEKLKEVFNHTGELMTELSQKEQSITRKDKEIDRLRKDLETLRLRIVGLGIGIDWEADMPNDNRINLGVDIAKKGEDYSVASVVTDGKLIESFGIPLKITSVKVDNSKVKPLTDRQKEILKHIENQGITIEATYVGPGKEAIGKVVGEVSEVIKLEDSGGNVIETFRMGPNQ